ncbi:MAG: conjugal transfer protein TraC, partial [Stackebrandtia sp.]
VVTLRHLPDELAPAATVLVLDAIWARLTGKHRRLVYVDEAWLLLQHGPGAVWLARMAKTARKRRAGLTVITQDAADLLSGDLGRVVIANSATQILMRQAPQTATAVAEAFNLTGAETDLLRTARQGDALLLAGEAHAAFASCASETEMPLLVTGEAAAANGDRG